MLPRGSSLFYPLISLISPIKIMNHDTQLMYSIVWCWSNFFSLYCGSQHNFSFFSSRTRRTCRPIVISAITFNTTNQYQSALFHADAVATLGQLTLSDKNQDHFVASLHWQKMQSGFNARQARYHDTLNGNQKNTWPKLCTLSSLQ